MTHDNPIVCCANVALSVLASVLSSMVQNTHATLSRGIKYKDTQDWCVFLIIKDVLEHKTNNSICSQFVLV